MNPWSDHSATCSTFHRPVRSSELIPFGLYEFGTGLQALALAEGLHSGLRMQEAPHMAGLLLHPHYAPTPVGSRMSNGFQKLGWLMGLEPTTTGITILDSTN